MMILSFLLGNELLTVTVSDDRSLWMSGRMTNGRELSFRELVEKSGQDNAEARVCEKIVKGDPLTMSEVETYVKYEFCRKGLRHVRTEWR